MQCQRWRSSSINHKSPGKMQKLIISTESKFSRTEPLWHAEGWSCSVSLEQLQKRFYTFSWTNNKEKQRLQPADLNNCSPLPPDRGRRGCWSLSQWEGYRDTPRAGRLSTDLDGSTNLESNTTKSTFSIWLNASASGDSDPADLNRDVLLKQSHVGPGPHTT